MIHLEHVNLVVSEKQIQPMLDFYKAAFPHWKIRCQGDGDWHGKARRWIHFGDDYQYLVFNDFGEGENRDLQGHCVGLAHFAYVTHNLKALIQRLESAGFPVAKEGGENSYRNNIYFIDPAGFEVEFIEYLSDLPEQRNS